MPYPKPIPDDPSPLPGGKRGTPGTGGGGSTGSNGAPSGSDPTNNSAFTSTGQATVVTIARGRVKLPATLIEKLPNQVLQPPAWATGTQYRVGNIVSANGNAYRCIMDGLSVAPPAGGGISQNSPYTNGQTVIRGNVRTAGGNAYLCLVGGTCGVLPPTGTGTDLQPGGGTHWDYIGSAPFAGYFSDFFSLIPVVIAVVWQYLQALPYNLVYQRPVLLLCEGPAVKVITIWQDKLQTASASGIFLPGGWELLVGPDAGGQALPGGLYDSTGYQHSAVLVPSDVFGLPTGTQAETPDVAVEIDTVLFDALAIDMNAADHVLDQMTHSRRGFGWPSSRIDSSVGGSGAASLRTWSDAKGVRYSHVLDSATAGVDIVSDHANTCNTVFLMSQGKLKAVPLDDTPTSSPALGAVNYVPNSTARYNITPNDVRNGQPVSFTQTPDPDRKNVWPVQYYDRAGGYVQQIAASPVLADIQRRGIVPSTSPLTLPFIFPDGTYPTQLSRVAAHASLYVCNKYTVTVGPRFLALEPGDIVTIPVGESISTFVQKPVRITQVDKGSDFWRTLSCVDYPAGIAAPAAFTPQAGDGLRQNGLNTIGSIPSAYQSAQLTNQGADNLFPNGTSENNPPSNIVVLNDGSLPEWDCRVNIGSGASFTGSISGTTLTAGAPSTGSISIGDQITGAGVSTGPATYVTALGTGTGGAGTYTVSVTQTVGSVAMTAVGAAAGQWVRQIGRDPVVTSSTISAKVPCSVGEQFYFSVQARSIAINGGGGVLNFTFFDVAGNIIGSPPSATIGSSAWAFFSATSGAAPVGSVAVLFNIVAQPNIIGGHLFPVTMQIDSIVARRMPSPGAVAQGLVTDSTGVAVWAGDSSWTAPTLASISNAGGGNQTIGFKIDPNGRVFLRGVGASTAGTPAGTGVFNLPSGYRPTAVEIFESSDSAAGSIRIDIQPGGAVVVQTALSAGEFISFSGISFSTN